MKKRVLSIFAVLAVAVNMVGCTPTNTAAPAEVTEQIIAETTVESTEIVEMKTVEPPEDGWTVEQLNEVMYLNGKPFKLPCTVEELGDGFTVSNLAAHNTYPFIGNGNAFDYSGGTLLYNGCEVGYINLLGSDLDNSVIFQVEFFGSALQENPVGFSINGVDLFSERTDIENKLGNGFEVSEVNGNYSYIINDTSAIIFAFNRKPENIDEVTDNILAVGYYCK